MVHTPKAFNDKNITKFFDFGNSVIRKLFLVFLPTKYLFWKLGKNPMVTAQKCIQL